jgi:hypothetical protein
MWIDYIVGAMILSIWHQHDEAVPIASTVAAGGLTCPAGASLILFEKLGKKQT